MNSLEDAITSKIEEIVEKCWDDKLVNGIDADAISGFDVKVESVIGDYDFEADMIKDLDDEIENVTESKIKSELDYLEIETKQIQNFEEEVEDILKALLNSDYFQEKLEAMIVKIMHRVLGKE